MLARDKKGTTMMMTTSWRLSRDNSPGRSCPQMPELSVSVSTCGVPYEDYESLIRDLKFLEKHRFRTAFTPRHLAESSEAEVNVLSLLYLCHGILNDMSLK